MKTSKPFSTISYNTKEFLIQTLKTLQLERLISYWEFIVHLPDTDDKKQHIHLYIEPNKVIDTESFMPYFIEQDPLNPEYPFKLHHIQSSKFGDWYWYGLHDKDYLKSKMLERNIHYSDNDIITSDITTHNYKVAENPLINYCFMGDLAIRESIFQAVNNGVSLQDLLYQIKVPLGKIQSVIHFYNALVPYYLPKKDEYISDVIPSFDHVKAIKKNQSIVDFRSKIVDIKQGQLSFSDDEPLF